MHLLVGLYFSEICMIGLFSLKGAYTPVVLTAILLVLTGLVHTSLIEALGPLLWSLPKSLTKEEDQPLLQVSATVDYTINTDDAEQYQQPLEFLQDDPGMDQGLPRGGPRAVEGATGASSALGGGIKKLLSKKVSEELPEAKVALSALASFWRRWLAPDPNQKSNFLLRWLHPEVYSDYTVLRHMIPPDLPDPVYPNDVAQDIYHPPSFMMKPPTLWIPRDPGGVSRQEVEHCSKLIPITDEYVSIDERGNMKINMEDSRLVFEIDRLRY
jgi:calcium permeable stress-gated cation channel